MLDKESERARLLSSPPSTLAEKVAATIGRNKLLSAKEVAEAINRTEQAISGWKKDGRVDKSHLKTLARLSGLPLQWWLPGEDAEESSRMAPWPFESLSEEQAANLSSSDRAKIDGAIALALAQLKLKMAVAPAAVAPAKVVRALVATEDSAAANDPDYVALPLKRVKIRAGVAGFSLDQTGDGTAGAVYVSRAWLAKRGINPEVAFASHVGGMSMWPRVQEGDVVVVNPADTERRNGIVYAFNHDGEFTLKRLKRQHNRWYLTSDNPDKTQFPPIHADEGTFMIGRAVLLQAEEI
ncbi:S24 family peptidase [Pigmentiphaga kullae]|uniref:Phage repressor protein C with HTH and peptisase S24 domain n=1 Tax=Pigmentiphaga kullae TaxID=151784 RepID=A0A4Q7NCE9_9BURK|nr:S24 family peptidase [Pigmentiphaga kullae]RZS80625.1 phage repressor protein C with HTH and peptisase S24 domain [Pigmentiphaga kullae]